MPRSTSVPRGLPAVSRVFSNTVACGTRLDLERLERRDCPTVVSVIGGGSIAEGGESLLLTVRLSTPATKAVQVGYLVSGSGALPAVVPADYRLSLGPTGLAGPSGNIQFLPGETVKQLRVAAVDDALREGTESLRFTLFRPVGCTVNSASSRVDISVLDNDAYIASLVPQGPSRIAEGAAAPFVIELSSPATRAETFFVSTQDGTATTADYRPLRDMPITILAGQRRSQPFALNTVVDSNNAETDEYFLVTARPRSADMPAIESAGVTIRGTGPAPLTVAVSSPSVVEGNAGFTACTFIVTLSAPALDPIIVQYATADGTASAGVDYVASAGSLTFARGQISKTVTVNVIGDTNVEDAETFQFIASTTAGGLVSSATGVATIRDDDTAFEIIVRFPDASLTPAQQQVFRDAARRWSEIIVGDLPDVTLGGRVIDDIEITATAPFIDGPGKILGSAGPREMRSGARGLPITGEMRFDSADVAAMVSNKTFMGVILHEMGHVIGIGTLWERFNLVVGVGGPNPQYVGAGGLTEYQSLLGSVTRPDGVPVENEGGEGTRDAHWRESIFRTELMTGYAEAGGIPMPISRLTVGSLEDLGYRVNYAAADPYRLPGPAMTPATRLATNATAMVAMALEQQRTKPVLRAAAFAGFS
jgi:hypothetical protein